MMGNKIVVTGVAGFIGSNLAKSLLENGYFVIGIDDLSAGTEENIPKGVDFHRLDIADPKVEAHLSNTKALFHLAARNCLADCAAHPGETARVNVWGTAHLMNACIKQKVPSFFYADTSAEYEGIEEFPGQVDRIRPLSVYACSKRGGALMCESLSRLHPIRLTTLRYFNVYGPAQDWRRVIPPVMSAFAIRMLSGERPIIYGTGEKRRDFIHVDDINRFHLRCLEQVELQGRVYNLGTGEDHSILEIFDFMETEIRSALKPLFKPELPMEAFRTQADISETLKTGWSPEIDIRKGIRDFVRYTRERLGLFTPSL